MPFFWGGGNYKKITAAKNKMDFTQLMQIYVT